MKMFQVRLNIAWKHTYSLFFSRQCLRNRVIYIFEKTINLNVELMGK